MPAPARSRPLKKDLFASTFKSQKPILFSETARPSTIPPYIRSLAWSPTGLGLATTSGSKIRVWNPDRPNVKSSQEFLGHTGTVERVVWNPSVEGQLGSTGSDGTFKIWDVRVGPGGGVGKGGGGGGGGGGLVRDVRVGDGGLFLTWSPDGNTVLVGRRDDVIVPVDIRMGTAMGEELQVSLGEGRKLGSGQVNQCVFSNSGREVFATTGEGSVKVLDWPSMTLLHTLNAHTSAAYSASHSPNGAYLAVGGGDSLITLWDTHDWVCKHTLSAMTGGAHNVSFSFDGTYIVGAHGPDKDGEKGIQVACAATGEYVHCFDTSGTVTVAAWHPLRYWLAYAGDPGGVKVIGLAGNL